MLPVVSTPLNREEMYAIDRQTDILMNEVKKERKLIYDYIRICVK